MRLLVNKEVEKKLERLDWEEEIKEAINSLNSVSDKE